MISRVWNRLWTVARGAAKLSRTAGRRHDWDAMWRIHQVEVLEVRLLLTGTDVSPPDYNFGWVVAGELDDHAHETSTPYSGGGPVDPLPDGSGGDGTGDGPPSGAGAPNIQITSAILVNGLDQPIVSPAIGQMIYIQANWRTTDLASTNNYTVLFSVDGVDLTSGVVTGQDGTNLSYFWWLGGWYASPGSHTVTVKIDGADAVSETNESDNQMSFSFTPVAPTTLPAKLSSPLGGAQFQDWAIGNYIDVDPRVGIAADYRGGVFQYDQHNGWDIGLPNFERMDSGIPVIASADGVVESTQDGLYDRNTVWQGQDWNYVTVDHGNGWKTTYGHLVTDSVTVVPGQTVKRGQILGFVGSSGNSTGPHLHYMVTHEGALVETNYDSNSYWQDPWTYQGDRAVAVLDSGTSNYNPFVSPTRDFYERAASKTTFSTVSDSSDTLWFWFAASHLRTTDTATISLIRPDGVVAYTSSYTPTAIERGSYRGWGVTSTWKQQTGLWHYELRINGQLRVTREVLVTGAASPAELNVRNSSDIVLDDRTTPFDIATTQAFTLQNYGGSTLSISRIDVPTGFSIVGAAPTSIAAKSSVTLTVQFTGTAPDTYVGDVVINSNDADNSSYAFRVRGSVTGSVATGTPVVTFQYHAVVAVPGGTQLIDPVATVTDSDAPANSNGYRLNVDVVSGAFPNDQLKISDGGPFSTSGTNLLKGATTIATYTIASPISFSLVFNANATLADIQNVLRLLAFKAGTGPLSSGQRIIRASVTDQSGKRSQYEYRTVLVPPFTNSPPVIADQDFYIAENTANGTVVGNVLATEGDEGQTLTYSITSGNSSGAFSINPTTGVISVLTFQYLDFETNPTFPLQVTVTDNGNPSLSSSATITVRLSDQNEAPSNLQLSSSSVDENRAVGTVVANLSRTDPDADDFVTYTLVTGAGSGDNALFTIVGSELRTNAVFNYEAANSYEIRIRTVDSGGLGFETPIIITVNNVNELPTLTLRNVTLSLFDNVSTSAAVHLADITVTDDSLGTNSLLLAGADSSFFEIVGGALRLKAGTSLNADLKSSYFVRVQVDDATVGTTPDNSVDFQLTINKYIPPIFVNLANVTNSVLENTDTTLGLNLADIVVTENGFGTNVISLSGADAARFEIDGTTLRLRAGTVLDYEAKSSYQVIVQVDNSSLPGASDAQAALTLSVINVNEVPSLALQNVISTFPENTTSPTGVKVADVVVTDDALGTNQLTLTGPDAAAFEIAAGTLRFKSTTVLNFEAQAVYHVTVRMDDPTVGATPDAAMDVTVNLTNINEPPVVSLQNVVLNLPEGQTISTSYKVADIVVTEDSLGSHTVGLSGADSALFEIVGTELRLKGGLTLNYESKSSYAVQVTADDPTIDGAVDSSANYVLAVTDLNETPTDLLLSATAVFDKSPAGSTVGTLSPVDPDLNDTFTYSLVSGDGSTDNASFSITGNSLKLNSTAIFETQNSYDIRLRVSDLGGLTFEKTFTITVIDVNELPTDLLLSTSTIAENVAIGTIVGSFSTTDPDLGGTFTYSLVGGAGSTNNSAFAIVNGNLTTAVGINFEVKTSYAIRVRTTDQGGLTFDKQFVITVQNLNEAPTEIKLSPTSVLENLPSGTTVGTLTAIDPDQGDTVSYSLVPGAGSADNSSFVIVNGQLQTTASFDLETQSSYAIRVRATDGAGLSLEKELTVTVNNVNEAPTDLTLSADSVSENLTRSLLVGTFTGIDADPGSRLTYEFVSGPGSADNASFKIIKNELWNLIKFDREAQSTMQIRVRTVDQAGLSFEKAFTISVTNVNEAPTGLVLSETSFSENASEGTVVGLFSSLDPDFDNTFTYSLVNGAGSADNNSFAIVNNQLQTVGSFDFESRKDYSIRVRTSDQNGLSFERSFAIHVNDGTEAPTQITLTSSTIAENSPIGSSVGTFGTSDPDAGNTFTYSLVNGLGDGDNASFTIVNGVLQTASNLDFETKSSLSIRVRTTDQEGLTFEKSFTISVTNGNDSPSISSIATQTIQEDTNTGLLSFTIGDLETPAGSLTVSVSSSNTNLVPNANLILSGTGADRTLRVSPRADRSGLATITIVVSDGINSSSTVFDVNVTAINDAPMMTSFAPQTILEDQATNPLAFSIADIDSALNELTISVTSSDTDLIPNGNLIITGTGANRSLVVTPAENRSGTATITVAVGDGVLATSQSFVVKVQPVDDPSVITLSNQPLVYRISGRRAMVIDSTATIADVDLTPLQFNGAVLRVSGHAAKDTLSVLIENGIGLRGKNVLFGTTVIGTLSGGKKGVALTVTLNSAATQNSVEMLMRSIGFKAANKTEGNRTLEFQITNIAGTNTNQATKQIEVTQ